MKRSEYIRRVRTMLIKRRDSLVRSLRNELNTKWSTTPATDVRDYGDAASDSEFRELRAELANADARDLHQINEAILRVDEGTYGLCSDCQRSIPIARLKALPYAIRCVRCQQAYDAGESKDWSRKVFIDRQQVPTSSCGAHVASLNTAFDAIEI